MDETIIFTQKLYTEQVIYFDFSIFMNMEQDLGKIEKKKILCVIMGY